ncbi:MAG: cyclic nucleotide-binding domain-containing protein [Bilophila wadsworthia]
MWRQVLDLGTRLRFRKGEEIMHGGEKGEYLYYVHQGEARLMRTTLDGREKILMSMRSGTVTGETPFFDEVPARSSIVAGTDCVVYAFSVIACFTRSLQTIPP